jgi:hypothetical protein
VKQLNLSYNKLESLANNNNNNCSQYKSNILFRIILLKGKSRLSIIKITYLLLKTFLNTNKHQYNPGIGDLNMQKIFMDFSANKLNYFEKKEIYYNFKIYILY